MSYLIDGHKLIYHPNRVSKWLNSYNNWEKAKKNYPIYIEISPTGNCNHRCNFCALDFIEYPNIELNFEILCDRLVEMKELGVKSVMFAGEGEPLLYKRLDELVEFCTKIGIDSSLTTNFVSLKKENCEIFIKNCKWIKVSINGGNAEIYSKVHNTNKKDYNTVINNLYNAVKIKNKNNYLCTIGTQILVLDENKNSIIELIEKVKEIGVDYIVIKPYSQHFLSKNKKNIDYSYILELENKIKKYNSDKFKVILRKKTISKTILDNERPNRCYSVPFFWAYIMSNGELYGCSSFLKNEKFCFGNIINNSFKNVWEGNRRKNNFELMKCFNTVNCRKNCRMDEINRYLDKLVHPISHINFI